MQRMALREPTYISEIKPNRFPAGAVLDVDEDTAIRWLEHGVAEPAAKSVETYKEKRRREIAAELAALEDDTAPVITMTDGRGGQPVRRGRRPGQQGRTVGRAKPMPQSVVMPGPSSESVAAEDDED